LNSGKKEEEIKKESDYSIIFNKRHESLQLLNNGQRAE